jgi:hypothetical protein
VGVDFLASNRGGTYNIHIVSGDGQGVAGLDMTRFWPGPGLIKNVSIDGFDHGIRQRGMDASMTFEHITLTHQRLTGIHISGSPFMSLRKVISHNQVPVFMSERCDQAMAMNSRPALCFSIPIRVAATRCGTVPAGPHIVAGRPPGFGFTGSFHHERHSCVNIGRDRHR